VAFYTDYRVLIKMIKFN